MTIVANIGVPMILFEVPMMIMLLIPIIFVEYLVAKAYFESPTSTFAVIKGITVANITSTLIGIPVSWLLVLTTEYLLQELLKYPSFDLNSPIQGFIYVFLNAAWLFPSENHLYWMVPLSTIFLLFPAYIASVYIESYVLRKSWKEYSKDQVRKASWLMNSVSYSILYIFAIIWLFWEILNPPIH